MGVEPGTSPPAGLSPLVGLGAGIAWRPALADALAELPGLRFTEVVAENVDTGHPPPALLALRDTGVAVVPHGVGLGLAGADRPDPSRLAHLAGLATRLGSPLVSEHVAFVRAGSGGADALHADVLEADLVEAGHLVPAPRTRAALEVLVDNTRRAQDALPVPLALENIAATLRWPEDELTQAQLLTELVERTGCWLLLDVANLHATCSAHGGDPHAELASMPLERVAYVHVAGGEEQDGVYLDTHAHAVPEPVLDLLQDLVERLGPDHPAVLLERDDDLRVEAVLADHAAVRERLSRALAVTS